MAVKEICCSSDTTKHYWALTQASKNYHILQLDENHIELFEQP